MTTRQILSARSRQRSLAGEYGDPAMPHLMEANLRVPVKRKEKCLLGFVSVQILRMQDTDSG